MHELVPHSTHGVTKCGRKSQGERQCTPKQDMDGTHPGTHEPGWINGYVMVRFFMMTFVDGFAKPVRVGMQDTTVEHVFLQAPKDDHANNYGGVAERHTLWETGTPEYSHQ